MKYDLNLILNDFVVPFSSNTMKLISKIYYFMEILTKIFKSIL